MDRPKKSQVRGTGCIVRPASTTRLLTDRSFPGRGPRVRNASISAAAFFPDATASTTVAAPWTISPAKNSPLRLRGAMLDELPIAAITMSHARNAGFSDRCGEKLRGSGFFPAPRYCRTVSTPATRSTRWVIWPSTSKR